MKYQLNREQYRELECLAYLVAYAAHMRERYGEGEPELERCSKTSQYVFERLDCLNVPHWVQNAVICFAANWRLYNQTYFRGFLASRNIIVA